MKYTQLEIKDEAFTKKVFKLKLDKKGILKTDPIPENLEDYYKFEAYISHQDKKKSLVGRVYDQVKQWMFKQKHEWIITNQKGVKSILDFGCGTGEFLQYIQEKGIRGVGIEPSQIAFKQAKANGIDVYKIVDEVKEKFEVITLFHVLEHVENYNDILNLLINKLEVGGQLLIAVPNHKSYDATYYKEKWAAWDVPRHIWHFSKNDIIKIGKEHDLKLIQVKPLWFDALYISMVSESYKGQFKWKGVYRGLISNLVARNTKEYSSNVFIYRK